MRVLQVIAEMGTGGAERVVTDLTASLLDDGVEVAVASAGGFRADRLAASGADLVSVPLRHSRPRDLARSVQLLRRRLASTRPDLVHTHNPRATLVAHLALRLAPGGVRPPVVTTVHGLDPAVYPRAVRVLDPVADRVVAVSDDVARRLVAAGLPTARVSVVPPAAPTPTTPAQRHRSRVRVRAGLGIDSDRSVVLSVARLAAPKRHDLLLEAWAALSATHAEHRDALLLVVGDGPDRDDLARRAAPQGERVRMLGERHDVADLLAAADVLVLASDREGQPVTVLEAFAAGLPVVASAVGGLRELPRDSLELVAPGSADALRVGLDRLLRNPQLRVAHGTTGTQWAMDRSAAAMYGSYRSIYTSVLGASRSGRG